MACERRWTEGGKAEVESKRKEKRTTKWCNLKAIIIIVLNRTNRVSKVI